MFECSRNDVVLKTKISTLILVLSILGIFSFISCKGTNDGGGDKEKIITLIDREYFEGGRYGFYWDGKNGKKQYIVPGSYLYQFEAPGFTRVKRMNAIAGGKVDENRKYAYFEAEPGVWVTFELEDSVPEPFEINAGVVIPIQVKGSVAQISLTIFKE